MTHLIWVTTFAGEILLLGGGVLPFPFILHSAVPSPSTTTSRAIPSRWQPGLSSVLTLAFCGSALLFISGILTLLVGTPLSTTLFNDTDLSQRIQPFAVAYTIQLTPLSAFFTLLISFFGMAIALYSSRYLHYEEHRLHIAALFNLLLLTGVLFVNATNILFFIIFLESTSLIFGILVMHQHQIAVDRADTDHLPLNVPPDRSVTAAEEHRIRDSRQSISHHKEAITFYFIANHFGGAFITSGLLLLAVSHQPNSFDLPTLLQANTAAIPNVDIIFLLLFIGFAIKLGLVPFHIWVPLAHPSSPTNTHALSLGVMIKVAILGFAEIVLRLHPIHWWWGVLVLCVGGATAFIEVRNALYGADLKDSLADHCVENYGIIMFSIGIALVFASQDAPGGPAPAVVSLALAAAFLHLAFHALFKSLLYLSTGAAYQLTGKNHFTFNDLGGLIHPFPRTAFFFVIGSFAIAGFPPLVGFISEWMTIQSFALAIVRVTNAANLNLTLLIALLASGFLLLTAFAMTAFAFVKMAGLVFLGQQHIPPASATTEVEWVLSKTPPAARDGYPLAPLQIFVMGTLTALCFLLGLTPWLSIPAISDITATLGYPLTSIIAAHSPWQGVTLVIVDASTHYSATLAAPLFYGLGFIGLIALIVAIATQRPRATMKPVYVGGGESQRFPFMAKSFDAPWSKFIEITQLGERHASPYRPRNRYRFRMKENEEAYLPHEATPVPTDLPGDSAVYAFFRTFYARVVQGIGWLAQQAGALVQNGQLRLYIFYILVVFICILVYIAQ